MRCSFYLLPIVFLLSACSDSPPEFTNIKPEFSDTSLKVIEIAETLEVIEVKTDNPIGPGPTLLASDEYIYLFDGEYSQRLLQIDFEGNLINSTQFYEDEKLNITSITNMFLKDGMIGIISDGRDINWFDENLKYIGSEDLPVQGQNHFPFMDGFATFNCRINELEPWDFFYSEKEILTKDIPISPLEHRFSYSPISPFSNWNQGLLFSLMFNDTLYFLNKRKELNRLVSLDFGAKSPPDGFLKNIKNPMELYSFFKESKYTYLGGSIFGLNQNNVLLEVNDQRERKLAIWNIEKNMVTIYPSIIDTSITGLNFHNPSHGQKDKLFFGYTGEYILDRAETLLPKFKNQLSKDYQSSYFIFVLGLKE
jgi:hypothetical protein